MSAPIHHVAWCHEHGKRAYTRRDARKVIHQLPRRGGMREYRCDHHDGLWHVGHLPLATVYGLRTAREVHG